MAYDFLLINCEQNKDDDVLDKLKMISGIKQVSKVVGAYDIIAKIKTKNQNNLEKVMIPVVKNIKGIRLLKTLTGTRS